MTQREEFEAWYGSQDQSDSEPERTYELSDEGMNEMTKDCLWQGWQAALAAQPVQPARDHRGEIIDVLCDDAFGETYKTPQTVQPSQARELSDEDLQPAVDAWFNEYIHAGRYPFAKRMRAAIAAINAKKN